MLVTTQQRGQSSEKCVHERGWARGKPGKTCTQSVKCQKNQNSDLPQVAPISGAHGASLVSSRNPVRTKCGVARQRFGILGRGTKCGSPNSGAVRAATSDLGLSALRAPKLLGSWGHRNGRRQARPGGQGWLVVASGQDHRE
jgi:hypothetical protein